MLVKFYEHLEAQGALRIAFIIYKRVRLQAKGSPDIPLSEFPRPVTSRRMRARAATCWDPWSIRRRRGS